MKSPEVVIGSIDTDAGVFGAVITPTGLARLTFPSEPLDLCQKWVERWEPHASIRQDDGLMQPLAQQLRTYLQGNLQHFDLALDLRGTPFQLEVWTALQQIPFGQVRSYADLATAIGRPKAVRAVGRANGSNPIPIIVPCHRVIGSNGRLVGYAGGLAMKQRLLGMEGVDLDY